MHAGFWRRVGAFIIDGLITLVAVVAVALVLAVVLAGASGGSWGAPEFLILFYPLLILSPAIYEAVMLSSERQATFGRMAAGIIVVNERGERISFGRAFGRYLLGALLAGLTYQLIYLVVAFTKRKQGVHDMAVGTYVIVKPSRAAGTQ